MWPILSVVVLGFLLGMKHATDPDHVVAVATIASREKKLRAIAPIGIVWGLGHTVTVMVVGVAIILFGVVIPPRLGLGMEFCVSAMLVLLGSWNLMVLARGARGAPSHSHPPDEIGPAPVGRRRFLRPLLIGLVHGLAGSAAAALLVLGTITDPIWAAAYLFVFCLGTIAGMLLVTMAMAMPVALTANRFASLHRTIGLAAAGLSLCFGCLMMYQIGIVHGLFSSTPAWIPE